jgi:hypothetical protein
VLILSAKFATPPVLQYVTNATERTDLRAIVRAQPMDSMIRSMLATLQHIIAHPVLTASVWRVVSLISILVTAVKALSVAEYRARVLYWVISIILQPEYHQHMIAWPVQIKNAKIVV